MELLASNHPTPPLNWFIVGEDEMKYLMYCTVIGISGEEVQDEI